ILGAASGVLFAAGNNELSPFMGMEYGLKGLVVMIIGGVTSLPGAVVAGLLLGIAEALAVGYLSSSFSMVISFGLLFVILLARPTGLFASASRASRPCAASFLPSRFRCFSTPSRSCIFTSLQAADGYRLDMLHFSASVAMSAPFCQRN